MVAPVLAYRSSIEVLGDTVSLFDRGHNVLQATATRDYLFGYDEACSPYAYPFTIEL